MKKQTVEEIIEKLKTEYPNARPMLKFSSPYELLVAVILSAQCKDERVNSVTEILFKEHNTPETMVTLSKEQLANIIKPCGLMNSKAEHILSASKSILEKFQGRVPDTMEELLSLDGVGRKTADVVLAVAFEKNAIAVDTHVFRVSNRIGLAKSKTPYGVEMQLMKILPEESWAKVHHYLIFHGRNICKSQKPKCENCIIKENCKYYKNK